VTFNVNRVFADDRTLERNSSWIGGVGEALHPKSVFVRERKGRFTHAETGKY
jgi:hypothetical protein